MNLDPLTFCPGCGQDSLKPHGWPGYFCLKCGTTFEIRTRVPAVAR